MRATKAPAIAHTTTHSTTARHRFSHLKRPCRSTRLSLSPFVVPLSNHSICLYYCPPIRRTPCHLSLLPCRHLPIPAHPFPSCHLIPPVTDLPPISISTTPLQHLPVANPIREPIPPGCLQFAGDTAYLTIAPDLQLTSVAGYVRLDSCGSDFSHACSAHEGLTDTTASSRSNCSALARPISARTHTTPTQSANGSQSN